MKKFEHVFLLLSIFFIGYACHHFIDDYQTVARWQAKAIANNIVKAVHLPEWVKETTTKVALEVWISNTANVLSILVSLISLAVWLDSRRRRDKP